jgi:hypothetical protein
MVHVERKSPWASVVMAVTLAYCLVNAGCSGFSFASNHSASTGGSGDGTNPPPPTLTISGSITPATLGAGVTVNLTGAQTAETTTDSLGNYSFGGLPAGTYTIAPAKAGVTFSPARLNLTLSGSPIAGANFTASEPLTPSGPIVINGENGTIIKGLKITSATGDCVTITNSTNITIMNSEVGPCAGNGIKIYAGTGISIYDSYIHPETLATGCCDHNDGVFAFGNPSNLTIQGDVIAYGESNIEVHGGTTVSVIGNLLLNPRGPSASRGNNFECWSNCSGVLVQNNYALSSDDTSQYLYPEATQDSINVGVSNSFIIQGNLITGGHSVDGCGIMADTFANEGQVLQNRLLNTGQCGIGLTDGTEVADSNLVYNTTPVRGSANTAMYVAHFGQSLTCGPMTITNNVSDEIRSDGTHSGWWNAGNCGTIDTSTDVFGAPADGSLNPVSTVFVPPLVPPVPMNCVALSPYSTQTSAAACIP